METKSGVRLGIALPQGFVDGRVDIGLVRRFAQRAEELGFDDLWSMEQMTGALAVLEPVTLLAYVAAVTTRPRLGTAVLVSTLRSPVHLAKELSSLDNLSGGRAIAGLGLGPSVRVYPMYGLEPEHRVTRFVEGLRILRSLLDQSSTTYDGSYARLDDVRMEPKPLAQPRLPVWLGARSPAALRRAVRHADGWMGAGSETMANFLEQLGYIRGLLAESGREDGSFALSKRVYIAIERDTETAREKLRPWLAAFYNNPGGTEDWAVCGSADHCVEALAPLVEAGANHLMLHPLYDNVAQMETIASELAPRL